MDEVDRVCKKRLEKLRTEKKEITERIRFLLFGRIGNSTQRGKKSHTKNKMRKRNGS